MAKNKSQYTHPRKPAFARKRAMQDSFGDSTFRVAMARMVLEAERETVGAGDKARAMMSVGTARAIVNRAEARYLGGK